MKDPIDTVEGNKMIEGSILIADFLGWEHYEDKRTYKFPNLYPIYNIDDDENSGWTSDQISNARFHSDWSWLMPVVEKIEAMKGYEVTIHRNFCIINFYKTDFNTNSTTISHRRGETKIEATWLTIVSFVQWLNSQK